MKKLIHRINFLKKTIPLIILFLCFFSIHFRINAQIAPNLGQAQNYALLADSNIVISDTISIIGKAGTRDSISPHYLASDTVLSNGAGSVSQALIDLDSAIQFCISQQSVFITNPAIEGLTFSPNVYSFSGLTTLDGTLNIIGDTNSIFIFILDSFVLDPCKVGEKI